VTNPYRAARLYRESGQFGQAERVLHDDDSYEGLTTRAASLTVGGDLLAAARLHEAAARLHQDAGQTEEAVAMYIQIGEPAEAARCLLRLRGDEALEDPRLAECLRRADDVDQLVRLCLRICWEATSSTRAIHELLQLRAEGLIPPALESDVAAVLVAAEGERRRPFEARAAAWATRARAEIDARFARIWGLDLGTTTCAVAIYDTQTGRPAPCLWKGNPLFASTLSVGVKGDELVGLSGEGILDERWAHLRGSKRYMGTRRRYKDGLGKLGQARIIYFLSRWKEAWDTRMNFLFGEETS